MLDMDVNEATQIFHQLFDKVDGRALSLKGREDRQLTSKSYVYGEVVPTSFYELIQSAEPQAGDVFYDLGSGTGKAVILADLLFNFSKVIGVELLDPLYQTSVQIVNQYEKEIRPKLTPMPKAELKLVHQSFLETNLKNADLIFVNSTCFQPDLMQELDAKLEEVRPNATIITLSKSLKSPAFHQYKHKLYDFSWGQATAFFHRKRLWKMYF